MKKIPVLDGKNRSFVFALVDDEDYDLLMQKKWCLDSAGYARTTLKISGKKTERRMHQLIYDSGDLLTDHRNRNKLDNQKSNFRPATRQQNSANRPMLRNNTRGYKGVWQHPTKGGKFLARIRVNNVLMVVGKSHDPKEAHQMYLEAAKKYFGEFACP